MQDDDCAQQYGGGDHSQFYQASSANLYDISGVGDDEDDDDDQSFDPSAFFLSSSLAQQITNEQQQQQPGSETDINKDLQVSESDSDEHDFEPITNDQSDQNEGFDIDEFLH